MVPIVLIGDCANAHSLEGLGSPRTINFTKYQKRKASRMVPIVLVGDCAGVPAPPPPRPGSKPANRELDRHYPFSSFDFDLPLQTKMNLFWHQLEWRQVMFEGAARVRPLSEQMLPPPSSVYPVSQADGGTMAAPPD